MDTMPPFILQRGMFNAHAIGDSDPESDLTTVGLPFTPSRKHPFFVTIHVVLHS